MLLDGDKVEPGDRLYHLSAGYGTVETIENNLARVKMDTGGILNMREDGYTGTRKLFYWYPPKFLLPRKGKESLHDKAVQIAVTVLEILHV